MAGPEKRASSGASSRSKPWGVATGVLLACAVGLLLRATSLAGIFPPDGAVVLGVDDSFFHARRALYTFENFPAILEFDRYLAYPRGAAQPSPPLFDWLIAGSARLFGRDLRTFERVAAWITPVLGALLPLCAFWVGRALVGGGVGLLASWLAAVLPAGVVLTSLGNCDHHAAVALLVSLWVAASLRELRMSGGRLFAHALLHAVIVAAMIFTWSGSLLYLAIGEGARLSTLVVYRPRTERFLAVAASALLSGAVAATWLLASRPPLGGPFSSQTLSWLHVIGLILLALLATAVGMLERVRPETSVAARLLRSAGVGACLALPLVALPEVREALATGLGFVAKSDGWAVQNPEQQPLFRELPKGFGIGPTTRFGYGVYAIPLLPLLVAFLWWRARPGSRDRWLLFFLWMLPLCALATLQIRYATDLAVLASVGFALALHELRRGLSPRLGATPAIALAAVLTVLTLSPLHAFFSPRIVRAASYLQEGELGELRDRLPINRSRYYFAQMVRDVTPETAGFLDAQMPEYGLLVPPERGHLFAYVARRPVPANNLGPYLDPDLHRRAEAFYDALRPAEALALLEGLQARYFVTSLERARARSFSAALHLFNDGSPLAPDLQGTGRIRLVTQGPVNGSPYRKPGRRQGASREPTEIPAYKLFELVAGAQLVGRAAPGATVVAELALATPLGPLRYRRAGRADDSGRFALRVPYATRAPDASAAGVRALDAWQVSHDGHVIEVDVSETDVVEGREVAVTAGRGS